MLWSRVNMGLKRVAAKMISKHGLGSCVGFVLLLIVSLCPQAVKAQIGGLAVQELLRQGFENVSCTEDSTERVYVIQNSAYRLTSIASAKAVDIVQKLGMPDDKDCRIVVLDNNVPQFSIIYKRSEVESAGDLSAFGSRAGWNTTYELGDSWRQARKARKSNSSLYKVDIVVYPQLMFRNYVLNRVYDYVVNLNPTIEVSLWEGSKLALQVVVPIHNDYGYVYKKVRPGYMTLSQQFRIENLFLTATVGNFNKFHWGLNLKGKYVFKDTHFVLDGEIGYYGIAHFDGFKLLKYDVDRSLNQLTYSVGASYFWEPFNTQFKLNFEQYLYSERGFKAKMVRHFRYASIGFYATKILGRDDAAHSGFNAGFMFAIALPPYKNKRHGYIPRVTTSDYWGISYNAGNEKLYGQYVVPYVGGSSGTGTVDSYENSFNPILVKTELFNY